jgi:hypothetical protein
MFCRNCVQGYDIDVVSPFYIFGTYANTHALVFEALLINPMHYVFISVVLWKEDNTY